MSKTAPLSSSDSLTINSSDLFEVKKLLEKVEKTFLPPELKAKAQRMLESLVRMKGTVGFNAEYDSVDNYLDWVCSLPWDKRSEDQLDLDKARDILDSTHYGLEEIKERILEYLAVLKMQKEARESKEVETLGQEIEKQGQMRSPVLFFVGLPGIGKTSIAYSIAKALNRQFVRIAMGGMGDALQLRGQSRMHSDAEPGLIIKGLRRAGVKNPVILLDEIDRTAELARAQIMGVLLELLDPEQNFSYIDHFIDYPFDLSEVLFIASANNTSGIANAVLDRMEEISMPGYSDDEKIAIAKNYLLPRQLKLAGLSDDAIAFDEGVWPQVTRPLGFDAGIRTMERTINAIVRKVVKKIVLGQGQKFQVTPQNIKEYLPR